MKFVDWQNVLPQFSTVHQKQKYEPENEHNMGPLIV